MGKWLDITYVLHVCAGAEWARRGCGPPGTEVTEVMEVWWECWELIPDSLSEQQVLRPILQSLKHFNMVFKLFQFLVKFLIQRNLRGFTEKSGCKMLTDSQYKVLWPLWAASCIPWTLNPACGI